MLTAKQSAASMVAVLGAVLAVGCGGSKSGLPAPGMTSKTPLKGLAQIVVKIPPATGITPQYISPSTKSMSIVVSGISTPQIINLTPASPGCVLSAGTLTCTETVNAPIGNDTFTITMFDQTNAAGNSLSTGSLTQAIAAGNNSVNITLGGVIAAIALVPIANQNLVQGAGPYALIGNEPQTFSVALKDADNNVIMGPGTPAAPTVTSSNPFAVNVTQTAGSAQFVVRAAQPSSTATLSTSVGTITGTAIVNTVEGIWVAGGSQISLFSAKDVLTGGGTENVSPVGILLGPLTGLNSVAGVQAGADGSLYVLNGDGNLLIYRPADLATLGGASPTNVAPRAVFNSGVEGFGSPKGMFEVSGSGDLWVTYTSDTTTGTPAVALYGGNAVGSAGGSLAAPADLPPTNVIAGNLVNLTAPKGIFIAGNGFSNGFIVVVDAAVPAINFYSIAAHGTTGNFAPSGSITGALTQLNAPLGVTEDATGNLYVSNTAGAGAIAMFSSADVTSIEGGGSGNKAPLSTTNGVSGPGFLVVDPATNLLVPNAANASFSVYATPLTASAAATNIDIGSNTFLTTPTAIATSP